MWEPDKPYDESDGQGDYIFTPVIPSGYELADNTVKLPEITVTVEGTNIDSPETDDAAVTIVTSFDELDGTVKHQTVEPGSPLEGLNLPSTLDASGYIAASGDEYSQEPGAITIDGVTWVPDKPYEESGGQESYTFTPVLPSGYELADDTVKLPEIEVAILKRNFTAFSSQRASYNQNDVDAFKKILEAHPTLNNVNGVDADKPESWQTAGLVNWNKTTNRLTHLYVSDKGLTGTLDVSGLSMLESIDCSKNASLDELHLGTLSELDKLDCYETGLSKQLDVSNCLKLIHLNCSDNSKLPGLKLGMLNDLTYLFCARTGIDGILDVSGCPNLLSIDCRESKSISGLTLKTHDNLTTIDCQKSGIAGTLDVSGCKKLEYLDCSGNPKLTGLVMGTHDDLKYLLFEKTGITGELNVSGYSKLIRLTCYETPGLTGLILGTHEELTELNCNQSSINGTLDISVCPKLELLDCSFNPNLRELKLGTHNYLRGLYCNNTDIRGTLDVSDCPELITIYCNDLPNLTDIKLGTLKKLSRLHCQTTGISGTLDVSGCPKLQYLMCHNNSKLTGLEMGTLTELESLYSQNNGIRGKLDVSGFSSLNYLSCSRNAELKMLDITGCTKLTTLEFQETPLTEFTSTGGYTLTVNAGQGGKAFIKSYDLTFSEVTLTATPEQDYRFKHWTGVPTSATNTDNPLSFELDTSMNVTAEFSAIDPNDKDGDGYHDGDVAAFQEILNDQLTLQNINGVAMNDPQSWQTAGLVIWNTSSPKRIDTLNLFDKELTGTLDVTGLTELLTLICNYNSQLDKLEGLESLTKLSTLNCSNCNLSSLEGLDKLTGLTELYCTNNQLTGTLDVGNLTKLSNLACNNNSLTELKGLDKLSNLTELKCYTNKLEKELDVSNLAELNYLSCYKNQLTGIKGLEKLKKLTYLSCHNNPLTGLDGLESLSELNYLNCTNNQLTGTLDLSRLSNLSHVECQGNRFTVLITKGSHKVTVDMDAGGTAAISNYDLPSNTVTLTATSEQGYLFTGWSGLPQGVQASENPVSFPLNENLDVSATFSIPATGVTLDQTSLSLYANKDPKTATLTATVTPDNATNQNISWKSSNRGIADVEQNGVVTAISKGTAIITVTTEDGNITAICTVTVTQASSDATLKSLSLSSGTLTPAFDPNVKSYKATVANNVTSVTINAEANDPDATVSGDGAQTLDIGENPFIITVTAHDKSTKEYTVNITRKPLKPSGDGNRVDSSDDDEDDPVEPVKYRGTEPELPKSNLPVVYDIGLDISGNPATGTVDGKKTEEAINKARINPQATNHGMAFRYDAKASAISSGFSITINRVTLDQWINANTKFITIDTNIVDLTFDLAALKEIQKQSNGDIILTAIKENNLSGDALAAIGSRPAYRFEIRYINEDGKVETVSDFGAGSVTIGIAYTPAATERTGCLYLVYSKDGNQVQWLTSSSYNQASGYVIGSTKHFSRFGVGYQPSPVFTDTASHWAKTDIDFAASRNLLAGTSTTAFSPDSAITRGTIVTALGRLAGVNPHSYINRRFSDVQSGAYYAAYVEWAVDKGIVKPTSDTAFSPNKAVSRQELAVIMANYTKAIDYTLPRIREAIIFVDNGSIAGSAKDAVQSMQMAGILTEKSGNRFAPAASVTRAEATAMLHRFVELTISPATAQG